MLPDSDSCNSSKHPSTSGASHRDDAIPHADAPNPLKRDRFELLSAYLDGEVSPAERRQVEAWLSEDPAVQRLYVRLLKLRQGMRTMPIPASTQTADETAQRVMSRLERRPKVASWAGMAIAAVFVGAVSVFAPPLQQPFHQMAIENKQEPNVSTDALMIALDHPIIEIPKSASPSPSPIQPAANQVQ